MEKKIGEKFEFRGVMLEVVESDGSCSGCYAEDDIQICHNMPGCGNHDPGTSCKYHEVPQTFADAYDALIEQADRVSRLEQTPEERIVSNETVDRLIAMRASLSPVTAREKL